MLIVSDPYKGLDYNKINTYETNYCSNYCDSQKDDYSDYFEEEEIEELEDEYRDSDDFEENNIPLIFNIDEYFSKR
jgi:hypothetical protein